MILITTTSQRRHEDDNDDDDVTMMGVVGIDDIDYDVTTTSRRRQR